MTVTNAVPAVAASTRGEVSSPTSRAIDTIPSSVVLMILSIVTTVGFCRVFDGWEYLAPMLTVVIGVHVAALVMRLINLPGYIAIPAQMLVLFALVGWKYYPSTMTGPFPSGRTWDFMSLDLQLAREQFPDAVAPVAAVGGFVVGAAFALGLAALLSDAFAFRAYGRGEATVPSAVLFVFAAALGIDNHRVAVTAAWLAAALAVIAILRASHAQSEHEWIGPRSRVLLSVLPLAAVLAGCAALGGAVIGPRLPGAGDEGLVDTHSSSETVNVGSPLVSIRSRLVNQSALEMISVASAAPHYWRTTSLNTFDGEQWKLQKSTLEDVTGNFADPGTRPVEIQQVRISGLTDVLLPAAYSPVGVQGGNVTFVADSATLVVPDGLGRGDEFDIVSALVDVDPAVLAEATSSNPPNPITLDLPDNFPSSVAETALDVTGDADTSYGKAIALQSWFRSTFTYDLSVQKGHGDNAMVNFLRIKRGYCEQFAGTFAAMARSLGLPSRVAVGFTPGDLRADGRYHVYGRNAHAWPELWFDDVGWVSFDPTPGRGEPGTENYTGLAAQQATADADAGNPGATATTSPAATPTTVADPNLSPVTTLPDDIPTPTTAPPEATATPFREPAGVSASTWLVMTLIVVVGAWLIGMPKVLAKLRERRRSKNPLVMITDSWERAARSLTLIGLGPHVGETPIEHARRVGDAAGVGNRTLRDLAVSATTATYGERGDNTTALRCVGLAEQVVHSVKSRLSVPQKVVNFVDPRRVRLLMH
ncbi:MAG: transglutaminaseTgpA domain-containing protein [Ilumatobacteraceae bacterium]